MTINVQTQSRLFKKRFFFIAVGASLASGLSGLEFIASLSLVVGYLIAGDDALDGKMQVGFSNLGAFLWTAVILLSLGISFYLLLTKQVGIWSYISSLNFFAAMCLLAWMIRE